MWTAQRGRGSLGEEPQVAQVGGVTLAEVPLGVYVDGERRNLPIYAPGGYSWKPNVGDSVLVLKMEDGGCVVGCPQSAGDLLAGEVKVSGADCDIHLTAEGDIALSGGVTVNGEGLEDMIERIVVAKLAALTL